MSETNFEIKINVPMIKELVSDKIYRSDASAFREQYVNALSHGCIAYHQEHGYTDDVNVHVEFDYGLRKVTITDNGMGMSKTIFSDNFMSFGFSTVDKETNNTRSGMFGLGAISFFRIATACIVESWDRKTEERFTFMTRNTDESEFVENRTLEGYGTKTEIFLKEHVRISTLIDMVKTIASNYPVKTILEITNSESEQTISTYDTSDTDSYDEYQPVMRFKDYVEKVTANKFVTLIDNDEMEVYCSTTGGNKNQTYLCRVPIGIQYDTGFTTYLNIKKEKIKGTDSKGRDKLQEVPKPDRDEVNEIAEGYFSEIIEKACDDMIHDIDIKSFDEYKTSDKRWILNGYSVDDKLNPMTHQFVQKMREPVRYRNCDGIQKRHETLLTLFGRYETIMFHPSLHKGTFDSIDKHLKEIDLAAWQKTNGVVGSGKTIDHMPDNFALVDDHCSQPLIEAKAFKKENKVKSIIRSGVGGSVKGLLVRDGSWNNYRMTDDHPAVAAQKYPGGLYYSDNWLVANEIATVARHESSPWISKLLSRNKSGIIIAKKAKKLYPSITELFDKILKASDDGKIVYMKKTSSIGKFDHADKEGDGYKEQYKALSLRSEDAVPSVDMSYRKVKRKLAGMYGITVLPIQCKDSLPFLKYLNEPILFVPKDLIHAIQLIGNFGDNHREQEAILQCKHMPEWTEWSDRASASAWGKYMRFTGRYADTNYEFRADCMRYFAKIEDGIIKKPSAEEYELKIQSLMEEYGEHSYSYHLEYQQMFPALHLKERAKELGFNETETMTNEYGSEEVYAFAESKDGYKPMSINGVDEIVAKGSEHEMDNYKAVIDDDGNPQLVYTRRGAYDIVERKGELVFREKINKWS